MTVVVLDDPTLGQRHNVWIPNGREPWADLLDMARRAYTATPIADDEEEIAVNAYRWGSVDGDPLTPEQAPAEVVALYERTSR